MSFLISDRTLPKIRNVHYDSDSAFRSNFEKKKILIIRLGVFGRNTFEYIKLYAASIGIVYRLTLNMFVHLSKNNNFTKIN